MKSLFIALMALFIVLVSGTANADVFLDDVPWISQLDTDDNLGTSWDNPDMHTMICGPVSLQITAHYLRNFRDPNNDDLKRQVDWLYDNELISAINNYNGDQEGTGWEDLIASAAYYFGLWNFSHQKINDLSMLNKALAAGFPVIVGVKTKMNAIFGAKHFMVLTGIDANNVYVSDPGRRLRDDGVKAYTIAEFVSSWATQSYCSIIFKDNYDVGYYEDGWHDNTIVCPSLPMTGNYCEELPPSQPFVDFYVNAGLDESDTTSPRGPAVLGYPTTKVVQYPESDDFFNIYGIFQTWVQDYYNQPSGDSYTLVLNPNSINGIDDWGVVFAVHGRIRNYWRPNYWSLGYPVCNEYYASNGVNNYAIQWFADGYGFKRKVALNLSTNVINDSGSDCFEIGDRDTIDKAKNQGYQKTGYNQSEYEGSGGGVDPEEVNEFSDSYTYDNTSIGIGVEAGDEAWSWRIINEQTEFSETDKISVILKLLDLKADFYLRYELYNNGESVWGLSTDTLAVDSEYGWDYSYIPVLENASLAVGDYNLRMFITSEGEESLLDAVSFQVLKTREDYIYREEESKICEATGSGTEPWSMVAINPKTVFTDLEKAVFLIGLEDVFINHRFKVVVSRNGEYYWEYTEANWRVVDPIWGWSYSYFNPSQAAGALAGEYRFDVYLDTGEGFFPLDSKEFTVERTAPDYVFIDAKMCKGYQEGSAAWGTVKKSVSVNF